MDSATLLKEIETLSSLWVHSVYQPVNLKKPADSVADIVMQVTGELKKYPVYSSRPKMSNLFFTYILPCANSTV